MKKGSLILLTAILGTFSFAQETDSTGLEGDNLDLNGVLELFKESESVEDFEKKLNTESNGVNNLDLNEDGEVDYIRVVDHADSNTHSLALQVPVTEDESQDVAVIEMEEVEEDKVNLQVIGDSELYGEEYMLEPVDEKNASIVVNVNTWRPVRHIYGRKYRTWVSPYRWGHYPKWHRPWRRASWAIYQPRVIRYHRSHYRRTRIRRCNRAHSHYHKHHVYSPHFKSNHKSVVIKSNNKKVGGKKISTVKKAQNGTVIKKQHSTSVKKSPQNNSVKQKKTTTVTKRKAAPAKNSKSTTRKKASQTKKKSTRSATQRKTSTRKGKR